MQKQRKKSLLSLTLEELQQLATSFSLPKFVSKQLSEWLYKHQVMDIEQMSNISKKVREQLSFEYHIGRTLPIKCQESKDGTKKYLFQSENGGLIESVFIPERDRATLCISSQVGCKMNCLFCQTGKQGFSGDLSTCDIINQVLSIDETHKLTNIVFMGMGEPLDNFDNVMKAIHILTEDWGLGLSPKRITLSTIGLNKNLKRFLDECKCHLAISVHNAIAEERATIMPSEKVSPIEKTFDLIRQYDFSGQRRLSIEYILFENKNDSEQHSLRLKKLLQGINCRVNLIPFHQIPNVSLKPLKLDKMELFKNSIEKGGFICTIRTSRGQDIDAACGMLSTKYQQLELIK